MNPVIFISGPYRGKTLADIEANVDNAAVWCGVVKRLGWVPLCPHTNSHRVALCNLHDFGPLHESYLSDALELLTRCDAVLMIERWEQSDGALAERQFAWGKGIPVFDHRYWDKEHGGIPHADGWQEWFFNWQRTQNFKEVEERYLPNADATCKDGLQVETQAEEADSEGDS